MIKKFTKTEKKTCKFYDKGKCKIKYPYKDCRPMSEFGFPPDFVKECKGFKRRKR